MPEIYEAEDVFILARRAEWAGDVGYCRRRLFELRKLTERGRGMGSRHPLAVLRGAGESILHRLGGREALPRRLVIVTRHLRGVVWQTGAREFELRAFLRRPEWEDGLYRHALLAAEAPTVTELEPEGGGEDRDDGGRQGELFRQGERAPEIDEGPSVSWEEDARGLLCVVTVDDFCLIKAKGLWAAEGRPQSAEEVTDRFAGILRRIEAPDPAPVRSAGRLKGGRA